MSADSIPTLTERAIAVINNAGKPLDFEKIYAALSIDGHPMPADKPKLVVRKALYNGEVFTSEKGLFSVKDPNAPSVKVEPKPAVAPKPSPGVSQAKGPVKMPARPTASMSRVANVPSPARPVSSVPRPAAPPHPAATGLPQRKMKDRIIDVLSKAGKPMSMEQVYDALMKDGFQMPSDKPKLVVRQALYNKDMFKLNGQSFELVPGVKSEPCPVPASVPAPAPVVPPAPAAPVSPVAPKPAGFDSVFTNADAAELAKIAVEEARKAALEIAREAAAKRAVEEEKAKQEAIKAAAAEDVRRATAEAARAAAIEAAREVARQAAREAAEEAMRQAAKEAADKELIRKAAEEAARAAADAARQAAIETAKEVARQAALNAIPQPVPAPVPPHAKTPPMEQATVRTPPVTLPGDAPGQSGKSSIRERIKAAIMVAGKPLHFDEIWNALQVDGYPLPAGNSQDVVKKVLQNKRLFGEAKPGCYLPVKDG